MDTYKHNERLINVRSDDSKKLSHIVQQLNREGKQATRNNISPLAAEMGVDPKIIESMVYDDENFDDEDISFETCEKLSSQDVPQGELEVNQWPVLKKKALSGIAGQFVELATRESEADPAAVLATFLARFAIEVGSSVHLMVGDTKHYARIFSVIVGASSKARKGTSAKPVNRLTCPTLSVHL